jgi:hypothetical protein
VVSCVSVLRHLECAGLLGLGAVSACARRGGALVVRRVVCRVHPCRRVPYAGGALDVDYFRTEAVQYYERFRGGAGVLQDCVDAFTVVILHDHSLSAFCGPLPHVKLFKFPFYKAAPPQRLVWELSLLVLPPFPFTGQGRCIDRVVYEDGVQFPESLPSP